ncbi:MAG: SCO family protein [Anaerolineaceae bacterium]|nr:SCO family protein [Anaerolineaceae bacterium]
MSDDTPLNADSKPSKGRLIALSALLTVATVIVGVVLFMVFDQLTQQPVQSNLAGAAAIVDGENFDGVTPIDPPRPVADFTLPSHTGQPFNLSDVRGKVVMLYFGYTHCPDICPLTLLEFKKVHELLGDDADQTAFVFASVDGERDTPEALAKYLQVRNVADFVTALSGEEGDMRRIGVDYGLFFEKVPDPGSPENYLMNHTAASFLLNKEGELVAIFSFGTEASVMADEMEKFIKE